MSPSSSARRAFNGAGAFMPASAEPCWDELRTAAESCRGCDLYQRATQTVFGEGHTGSAAIMLVGEQPGDQEDREGHPFVGPAGALLARACHEAGIERDVLYLTNTVKHFRWRPAATHQGGKRMHQTPSAGQVQACRPWLQKEIEVVQPAVIVLLGATAARSLLGEAFRISRQRGDLVTTSGWARFVLATYHPSAVLRAFDGRVRARLRGLLVEDLRTARSVLGRASDL